MRCNPYAIQTRIMHRRVTSYLHHYIYIGQSPNGITTISNFFCRFLLLLVFMSHHMPCIGVFGYWGYFVFWMMCVNKNDYSKIMNWSGEPIRNTSAVTVNHWANRKSGISAVRMLIKTMCKLLPISCGRHITKHALHVNLFHDELWIFWSHHKHYSHAWF